MLGLAASSEQLIASFEQAADFPLVKGFAVGRTIFADPAKRWLSGEIGDASAKAQLKENVQSLVVAWDALRSR